MNSQQACDEESKITFSAGDELPIVIIEMKANGDFYYRGKLITNDFDVFVAFRQFLADQNYPRILKGIVSEERLAELSNEGTLATWTETQLMIDEIKRLRSNLYIGKLDSSARVPL